MKTTLIIGTMLMAHLPTFGAYECQTPMMTPWGEKVTSDNCWRGYPRPQMVREGWTCLNGDWDYAITAITNTMARPAEWAVYWRGAKMGGILDFVAQDVIECAI